MEIRNFSSRVEKYFNRPQHSVVKYISTLGEKFLISVRPCDIVYLIILISHCFFQLAPNSSWHGTPGKHVVYCNYHYVRQGSLPDCEYHVDATSNRAVLPRLDSAKGYNVFIKMCNKEQICSAGGEPYMIKKLQGGLRK